MKNEMLALILAGGQGTRLGKLTQSIAKPAVQFGGRYLRRVHSSALFCERRKSLV